MHKLIKVLDVLSLIILLPIFLSPIVSVASPVLWSPIGSGGGGWLPAITVLDDANSTIYVACDVGGIYKSTDHGQTWKIKNNGLSIYYVEDIAYDPIHKTTLYAATRGGVYKSTNGGDSWTIKRTGFPPEKEFNFSAPVSDIEVDPVHPNILYAGVGVPRQGYDLSDSHWLDSDVKGTIYKSTDSAENWTTIYNTGIPTSAMIYSLAIDPGNTNVIYATTTNGVYKSINAGVSWVHKSSGLPSSPSMTLVINPSQTNTLYVTVWVEPGSTTWNGGVYKSTDGGNSWVAKNNGINKVDAIGPDAGSTLNFPNIIIDKNNPQTLYIGNSSWVTNTGIYKTTNGGNDWTWITNDDPGLPNKNVNSEWITQHGLFVMSLAIDPKNSNRIYFGTSTHLIKTDNGGTTWDQIYTQSQDNVFWKGRGLESSVVAKVAVDPKDSSKVYAGYWDLGFLKSIDGGVSFKRTFENMRYDGNTFDIIVDPTNSNIIYAATGWWEVNKGTVVKSIDFGESWTMLDNGLPDAQIWSIALDKNSPANSRTLYATSYHNGIFKTTNGGQSWSAINTGLGVNGNLQNDNLQIRKIYIDPNNSEILYAGIEAKQLETNNANTTVQGGLYKSTNKGANWSRIDNSPPLQSQLSVWDIAIPVGHSNLVYTAVSSEYDHLLGETFPGGVFKSTDGGGSWGRVNTGFGSEVNLNVSSIEISPENHNILYAVTTDEPYHDRSSGRGIFKTENAGNTWQPISSTSYVQYFGSISIDPSCPSVLYAGSSGNGILKGIDLEVKNNKYQAITRGEMAKAFLQALNIPPLNVATGTAYSDVTANHPNAIWIKQFKAKGFATECQANHFCPDAVVTKEYIARVFLKVLHGASYLPEPSANGFIDVAPNSINEDWITALRNQGFTQGCSVNKFCPQKVVSHEWLNSLLLHLQN